MRLYGVARMVIGFFLRCYFRQEVDGAEKVPPSGGFVLAANHASYLDPPALGVACPRPVHFMAKSELFKVPVLGAVLPEVGAFPVHRGAADRKAIRHALEILAGGGVVGVFPEGTRSRTGELLAPQGGAALLALKAGVPVVPAAIWGTNRVAGPLSLPKPVKVGVCFGDAINLGEMKTIDRKAITNASEQIMRAIGGLLPGGAP